MTSRNENSTQKKTIAAIDYDVLSDFPGERSAIVYYAGCNYKCIYCHNKQLLDTDEDDCMSFDDALDVIKNTEHTAIVFSGGEPTLNPVHLDIKKAKEAGFKTKLFTNGSKIEEILKCLPYLDAISIDYKFFKANSVVGVDITPYYKSLILALIHTILKTNKTILVDVRSTYWADIQDDEKKGMQGILTTLQECLKDTGRLTIYEQEARYDRTR